MSAVHPAPPVTALILAGGLGTRMGGADKGWQPFQGQPLVRHALARLQRQTLPPAHIVISANRNPDRYQALGLPVWPDTLAGEHGPLAGMLAGLERAATPLLLTVPCDAPRFPLSLCERLALALLAQDADMAMAFSIVRDDRGGTRPQAQPVFCLLRTRLAASLHDHLRAGGRRVRVWAAQHRCAEVLFDGPDADPLAFANLNTLDELRGLERARC